VGFSADSLDFVSGSGFNGGSALRSPRSHDFSGRGERKTSRTSLVEGERRSSKRVKIETPVTFEIGRRNFFGTTANLSDDGMVIESSFARDNIRKVLRSLLKSDECPVRVRYSAEGKSFARRGVVKHYHLDFSGGQSVYRLSFGVWIPKLRIRQEKGL